MHIMFIDAMPDADQYFQLFQTTGWNEKYGLTKEELFSTLIKSYFCVSAYGYSAPKEKGSSMKRWVLSPAPTTGRVWSIIQGLLKH